MGELVLEQEVTVQTEVFYTEGPDELLEARMQLADQTMRRAQQRIAAAKVLADDPEQQQQRRHEEAAALQRVAQIGQQSSEIADERPISDCAFSPDGTALAACGWGGLVSVWGVARCQREVQFRAHDERCTGEGGADHQAGRKHRFTSVLCVVASVSVIAISISFRHHSFGFPSHISCVFLYVSLLSMFLYCHDNISVSPHC